MEYLEEIDKLQDVFRRLNITSDVQIKPFSGTSSGKYIIGNFYYTGGEYKKDPYFLATLVSYTTLDFLVQTIRQFSEYDLIVTSIHNPVNDFHLTIPRFQTPSQLEMLLDIQGK